MALTRSQKTRIRQKRRNALQAQTAPQMQAATAAPKTQVAAYDLGNDSLSVPPPGGVTKSYEDGTGFAPDYVGDLFPGAKTVGYDPLPKYRPIKNKPIEAADYNFTDPAEFMDTYGPKILDALNKNYDYGKELALKNLDTELTGLKNFVPGAAGIKRDQTAADNTFNQAERTRMVDTALPGVRDSLKEQTKRAEAYAAGRAPDSITDRGLELGIRSNAADRAAASGFGVRSAAANKVSDLMSAEQRIGLSQYGDSLLSSNVANRANLEMAPTQYSDAGAQVRVTPEIGAGRQAASFYSEANQYSTIPAGTALSAIINQEQFETNLDQRTNEFNQANRLNTAQFNRTMRFNRATFDRQMQMQADQFNANAQNQFALGKFQYEVGYAGAKAGAEQTAANVQLGLAQQGQATSTFQDFLQQSQAAGQAGAISGGIGGLMTAFQAWQNSGANTGSLWSGGTQGGGTISGGDISGTNFQGTGTGNFESPEISAGQPMPEFDPSYNPPDTNGSGLSGGSPELTYTPESGSVSSPEVSAGNDMPAFDVNYNDGSLAAARSFTNTAGLDTAEGNKTVTKEVLEAEVPSTAVLASAGMSTQPQPGYFKAGYNSNGQAVYSNTSMSKSSDMTAGGEYVSTVRQVLEPTGIYSSEDAATWDRMTNSIDDPEYLRELSAYYNRGDSEGFMNSLTQRFSNTDLNSIRNDPKNKAGVAAARSAYNLYDNWDKMSAAQKTMGIAGMALQGYQFSTGENLGNKYVIKPTDGNKGLTVGQTMSMLSQGINVYGIIQNWDELNDVQRVTYGTGTAAQVAQTAQRYGFLGSGTNNAAVPNISAEKLSSMGWSSAADQGVGAITAAQGSKVPDGYVVVDSTSTGQQVAIPEANASTNINWGQAAGAAAQGVQAYDAYNRGDYAGAGVYGTSAGVNAAAAAGSTTAASYVPYVNTAVAAYNVGNTLADDNLSNKEKASRAQQTAMLYVADIYSFGLASVADAAIRKAAPGFAAKHDKYYAKYNPGVQIGAEILDSFDGSKGRDQQVRDKLRDHFEKIGLASKNQAGSHEIELADGSKFDIGRDGNEKLTNSYGEERHYYDADLNDPKAREGIGYTQGVAAILSGQGEGKQKDYVTGMFTNAVTSNGDARENAKHIYAKAGLDRDSALGIISQMEADEKAKMKPETAQALRNGIIDLFGDENLPEEFKTPNRLATQEEQSIAEIGRGPAMVEYSDKIPAKGREGIYRNWGSTDYVGNKRGSVGGDATVAGTFKMGDSNGYTGASLTSIGTLGTRMKQSENADIAQVESGWKKSGLTDSNMQIQLADGRKVPIAGREVPSDRKPTNPNRLAKADSGKVDLKSHEIDYTNDLDYTSGVISTAFNRILLGGSADNIDVASGRLANAALANVGFGKEMSPQNYNKMLANQRAQFSKVGIADAKDAKALANQAYAENRINATQLYQAHKAFDLVFSDNSYEAARGLLAGRDRAIQVIDSRPNSAYKSGSYKDGKFTGKASNVLPGARPKQPINRKQYNPATLKQVGLEESRGSLAAGVRTLGTSSNRVQTSEHAKEQYIKRMTREEIAAMNASRYGKQAQVEA